VSSRPAAVAGAGRKNVTGFPAGAALALASDRAKFLFAGPDPGSHVIGVLFRRVLRRHAGSAFDQLMSRSRIVAGPLRCDRRPGVRWSGVITYASLIVGETGCEANQIAETRKRWAVRRARPT